jgi:hypothetical protein
MSPHLSTTPDRCAGSGERSPVGGIGMFGLLCLAIAVSACSPPGGPVPGTATRQSDEAAVVRSPAPGVAPPSAAGTVAGLPPASSPIVLPDGSLYVCITEAAGAHQQTAIEFPPKVGALCAKHPEMGPCQYERQVCRDRGGRVYGAGGVEITLQTEAEYDRKVTRVRFKAN